MKTTILTLLLTFGGISLASAQTQQTPPPKTGEQPSTSGSTTTTGAGQTSPSINNGPRQSQGSGHIDVQKSPGTPLPSRRKP